MGRALLVLDTPSDRQKAVHWIGKAPVGTRVEFKASKRTLPQNDMLWALLTEFAQQFEHIGKKYEPAQWKAIFLHAFGREISFLPSLDGKTFLPIEMSSSDLSKQEMTDFIEFILKEAADRGIVLHNPKEQESGSQSSPEPVADEQSPASSAPEADGAPSPSASNSFEWLPTVARMLWAATHDRGDVEDNIAILNNQRMACNVLDHTGPTDDERLKAGSIYRVCKDVVMRTTKKSDAMKIVAGHAGIEIGAL
ncbi:recombination protein NinB [Rhizobium sp. Root1220]|uniref:recombination protein NinB n=1 Tax=Rhizobium sp. Root1220 TaxID=1736432 RepID=UPI0009EAB728|nr:recombination protein NinB [Rhizobium sp. Root1220]